jgi:hypothetical protein
MISTLLSILSKMLGITCDNAKNMDSLFENFEVLCEEEGIEFDTSNQRVRCLAHIINLAAQSALKSLKCLAPEEESSVLNDDDNETMFLSSVINKVKYFLI